MLTFAPALNGSPVPLDGLGAPVPAEAGQPAADFAVELALAVRAKPALPRGAIIIAPAPTPEMAFAGTVVDDGAAALSAESVDIAMPPADGAGTARATETEATPPTQAGPAPLPVAPPSVSAAPGRAPDSLRPAGPPAAAPIVADAPASEDPPALPEAPGVAAETTPTPSPPTEAPTAAPVPTPEASRSVPAAGDTPATPTPAAAGPDREMAREVPARPDPRAVAAEGTEKDAAEPAPDEPRTPAAPAPEETDAPAEVVPALAAPARDPAPPPPAAPTTQAAGPPSPEAAVAAVLPATERPPTERPRAPRPATPADTPVEPAGATGSAHPAEARRTEDATPPQPLPAAIAPAEDGAADAPPADAPIEAADGPAPRAAPAEPAAPRAEPAAGRPAPAVLAAEAPAMPPPVERPAASAPAVAPHAASARSTPMAPSQQIAPVLITLASGAPGLPDSLTLTLDPQELGRIEVEVTRESERRVAIAVLAERPETLHLLMRDAALLDRALAQAGVGAEGRSLAFDLGGGSDGRQDRGAGPPHRTEPAAATPAETPRRGDPLSLLDIAI